MAAIRSRNDRLCLDARRAAGPRLRARRAAAPDWRPGVSDLSNARSTPIFWYIGLDEWTSLPQSRCPVAVVYAGTAFPERVFSAWLDDRAHALLLSHGKPSRTACFQEPWQWDHILTRDFPEWRPRCVAQDALSNQLRRGATNQCGPDTRIVRPTNT